MKNKLAKYYLKWFASDQKNHNDAIDYEDPNIDQELKAQWNNISETESTYYDSDRGWQNISQEIQKGEKRNERSHKRVFSVSIAASISYITAAIIAGVAITATFSFLNGDKFKVKEIYVHSTGTQDERTITLADGTTVKLGAQSKLTHPANFDEDQRTVDLDGQAFFNVTKDTEKHFEVNVSGVKVKVLGTSFEVFEDKTRGIVETILVSGKVALSYNKGHSEGATYEMYPDQKVTLFLNDGKYTSQQIDAGNYCAWRNYNGLHFVNEKIENIVPRLERWYKCKIVLDDARTKDLNFTFKVRNESIETIMKLLTRSADLTYTSKEDETNEQSYIYTLKYR